jgi:glycyl-tRNA synthetase alpha subunit
MPATYGTAMLGAHATRVLATIDGVSAVRIEDQYIDLAMLSYTWNEPASESAGIDRTLWCNGMRRIG